jgi:RNA polymerase sigma factor (TIGR02999 family)
MDADLVLTALRDDSAAAEPRVSAHLYGALKTLAANHLRRERAGHTLQPTALVHEAWLRIVGQPGVDAAVTSRFFAIAAATMRRVLIDHARRRDSDKRGGGRARVTLDESLSPADDPTLDVLALEAALGKLQARDARAARVVELRVFGGATMEQIAQALGVVRRTVQTDWLFAQAFLRRELAADSGPHACSSTGDA